MKTDKLKVWHLAAIATTCVLLGAVFGDLVADSVKADTVVTQAEKHLQKFDKQECYQKATDIYIKELKQQVYDEAPALNFSGIEKMRVKIPTSYHKIRVECNEESEYVDLFNIETEVHHQARKQLEEEGWDTAHCHNKWWCSSYGVHHCIEVSW